MRFVCHWGLTGLLVPVEIDTSKCRVGMAQPHFGGSHTLLFSLTVLKKKNLSIKQKQGRARGKERQAQGRGKQRGSGSEGLGNREKQRQRLRWGSKTPRPVWRYHLVIRPYRVWLPHPISHVNSCSNQQPSLPPTTYPSIIINSLFRRPAPPTPAFAPPDSADGEANRS